MVQVQGSVWLWTLFHFRRLHRDLCIQTHVRFRIFNHPGILPQTVITEYIVTTFVGILFWEAFEQTRTSFFLDKILRSSYRRTKELLSYQWDALEHTLSKKNILDVGQKIRAWLTGDFMERIPKIRGDVFVSISFASLLQGHRDSLAGPLGEVFMESIRDRWPDLSDASIDEFRLTCRRITPTNRFPE